MLLLRADSLAVRMELAQPLDGYHSGRQLNLDPTPCRKILCKVIGLWQQITALYRSRWKTQNQGVLSLLKSRGPQGPRSSQPARLMWADIGSACADAACASGMFPKPSSGLLQLKSKLSETWLRLLPRSTAGVCESRGSNLHPAKRACQVPNRVMRCIKAMPPMFTKLDSR